MIKNEYLQPRKHYDTEGYAIFRNVVDRELVSEASNHVDWLLAKNPGLRPEQLHHHLIKDDPFWVRLISDDRLLDIAELFIGPDIALFASHYISKPPRDGQAVLWHQDGSYWPLDPMNVITFWLAIDESTPENGCVRVIPKSHLLGLQEMKKNTDNPNVLESEIDPKFVDESKAVDMILKPGDVSCHHPNMIHGSNANNSPKRRCGLTIRYIPTTTRIIAKEEWPSAFMLRGKPIAGINHYLPRPKYTEGKHFHFRDCINWK